MMSTLGQEIKKRKEEGAILANSIQETLIPFMDAFLETKELSWDEQVFTKGIYGFEKLEKLWTRREDVDSDPRNGCADFTDVEPYRATKGDLVIQYLVANRQHSQTGRADYAWLDGSYLKIVVRQNNRAVLTAKRRFRLNGVSVERYLPRDVTVYRPNSSWLGLVQEMIDLAKSGYETLDKSEKRRVSKLQAVERERKKKEATELREKRRTEVKKNFGL